MACKLANAAFPSVIHEIDGPNPHTPTFLGFSLRNLSLATLALQNSFLILVMRFSRTIPGAMYLPSTAVFLSELLKLLICVAVYFREQLNDQRANGNSGSLARTFAVMNNRLFGRDSGFWKLSIPAILYTIQNNLQYMAVSRLDPATFQVTYQLKILTTAVLSVAMLGKSLSLYQWVSLCVLTAGVALVQLPTSSPDGRDDVNEFSTTSRFIGLVFVLIACCLSGLAGVYFERILKKTPPTISNGLVMSHAPSSIWERNIQLSLFGTLLAGGVGVLLLDNKSIVENGFWHGYSAVTIVVIGSQALGGLLVAVVVKYADNILKGFATSISIIISSVISVWLFDFEIEWNFIVGSFLVIYATYETLAENGIDLLRYMYDSNGSASIGNVTKKTAMFENVSPRATSRI